MTTTQLIEKDMLIFQHKIELIELARERYKNNASRPFGAKRESELISILNGVSCVGIDTNLVTCERDEFEQRKNSCQI